MIQISLIIPAYNEGARLPPLLRQVAAIGAEIDSPPVEIIVVDDGSRDSDLANEQEAVNEAIVYLERLGAPHKLQFLASKKNAGKGAAIRKGWQKASLNAEWLAFLDADGAVSAEEFWRLACMLKPNSPFEVLAGSRIRMASKSIRRSLLRHLQGRVFATFVEHAFELGFYDTQCGLKFVRASLLRQLLPYLQENRWLFDVELLAALRRNNARFVEEPIDWSDPGGSKVRPGIDATRMLIGLGRIRTRLAHIPSLSPSPSLLPQKNCP